VVHEANRYRELRSPGGSGAGILLLLASGVIRNACGYFERLAKSPKGMSWRTRGVRRLKQMITDLSLDNLSRSLAER
jgi:hypothetical protein